VFEFETVTIFAETPGTKKPERERKRKNRYNTSQSGTVMPHTGQSCHWDRFSVPAFLPRLRNSRGALEF